MCAANRNACLAITAHNPRIALTHQELLPIIWRHDAKGDIRCNLATIPGRAYRQKGGLQRRHRDGQLSFDDFNRALEAPLHLARQTDVRASRGVIREVIEGLRALGLVEGPDATVAGPRKPAVCLVFSLRAGGRGGRVFGRKRLREVSGRGPRVSAAQFGACRGLPSGAGVR